MAERTKSDSQLVLLALGGLGEIGMNTYLYGLGPAQRREWLMVDLGVTFPHENEPGVDVVLPDLRFIENERAALSGLVLTHAHEDHIGAVLDLWPRLKCPIYATPFTAGMLRSKVKEYGSGVALPIKEVALGSRFKAGRFDIELVTLAHSIPEPSALAIRTPHGLVFHTGDWKFDPTPLVGPPADVAKLQAIGSEGVLALVCDSTNAFRDGRSPSELDVARSIAGIIEEAKRRVAVTTFASNVARVKAVADAAAAAGRKLVVAGLALHRVIGVAKDTGYLPEDFSYLDQEEGGYLKPAEIVALCTGSQGEPRAAMARIAEDKHPDLELGRGDLVIFSSRTIPGNEKAVGRIQNNLARLGCEILTDAERLVHVTGHPRRDELKTMYEILKPKVAIPMHGEARHLREHGELARAAGVSEVVVALNGDIVLIGPGTAKIIDEAPVGRVFRDGHLVVPDADGPVRQRRKLAAVGLVAVALAFGRKGEVLGEVEVACDGLPDADAEGYPMREVVLDAVENTLKSLPPGRRRDIDTVKEALRRAVRAGVDEVWGKKPIVKILATRIDGGRG